MTTNDIEIVIPGFGTGGVLEGRNGEPTYDKKYKVYNGHLTNAKTKGKIKLLKKEGRGKNVKLVLAKRYENIVRNNWNAYVANNEDNLPLKMNANKMFKLLKEELNVAPNNNVLDELKPLMRELVVEYNTKKNYKKPELTEAYRKIALKKLNDIQNKQSNEEKFDLTQISLKDLIHLIRTNVFDRKLMFRLKRDDENSDGHMYALTDRTINNLMNGYIDDDSEVVHGSDETLRQISFDTSSLVLIALPEEQGKKRRTRKGGAFFKWLNNTDYDLSLCGVFHNLNPFDYLINCLALALKSAGLDSEKLNVLIGQCCSRHVPKCKLKEVCETCEICIRLHFLRNDGREQVEVYGNKQNTTFDIGLLDEHYFWIYDTGITSYSIENYHQVKNEPEHHQIIYKRNSGTYKRSSTRGLNSFQVLKLMLEIQQRTNIPEEDKLLSNIFQEPNLLFTSFYDIDKIDFDNIETLQSISTLETKYLEYKEKNYASKYKITIDTETFNDASTEFVHTPFVVCVEDENGKKQRFYGRDAMENMLNDLPYDQGNIMIYIHNANYDIRFMFQYLSYFRPIFKGNRCIYAQGGYKQKNGKFINLTVKDTYCMISLPLSDFAKSFKLDVVKEVMPYKLYNSQTLQQVFVPIKDGIQTLLANKSLKATAKKEEVKQQFIDNIDAWNCRGENDTFNIVEYASRYCEIDVSVLKQGYAKFRNDMLELTGLDCDNFITIQSMAEAYLLKEGVYSGVYKISGFVQQFIHKCIVGGRTMTNSNKMFHTKIKLADFDACSLYPSAMALLGYLKGLPKVLQPDQLNYDFLKSIDGYFIKVRITHVGKKRQFPLLSKVSKDKVRQFNNSMVGELVYVDKNSLEDLIEFQNVGFEVVQGYYFDEGRNYKIQEIIGKLYNKRKEMKSEKNPAEVVIKLFMNSMYGKSILKPIETEIKVFNNKDQFDNYVYMNHNMIEETNQIGSKYFVKVRKAINNHFNYCHVGCEILSMSKRIMNQVMCLAEDLDILMVYTDTDSIHIESNKVKYLGDEFQKKYGRQLIGKDLGQFHVDFSMFDEDGEKMDVKTDINSIAGYFLGKKVYNDLLEAHDEHNKPLHDHHTRLKSVSGSCIKKKAQEEIYKGNVMNIYKDLFDGVEITFDLKDRLDDKDVFEFGSKEMNVSTRQKPFTREIKFDLNIERIYILTNRDVKKYIDTFNGIHLN